MALSYAPAAVTLAVPTVRRTPPAKGPVPNRLYAAARDIVTGAGENGRLQQDAILAFGVRVAGAGLLYLSQVVLARWMGAHEYGVYVAVWTMVLVLGGLAHGGLNLGMIRLLSEHRTLGEFGLARGLLTVGRCIALLGGTLIALSGMALVSLFPGLAGPTYTGPMLVALACLPFFALTDVQDGIGRGAGWMAAALLPPYVIRPLALILAFIALTAAGAGMDARTAAASAILACAFTALLQLALVNRRIAATFEPGPARSDIARWMAASSPLLLVAAAEIVLQNADILAVSRFVGARDAGLYFASAKTMSLIMFVHYAVGSAVAKRFAALNATRDHASLQAFVREAVAWTFWPSLAAAILILAFGYPLLSLFGPEFAAGYPVMAILVAGLLIRSATGPAEFLLNMLGEQRLCATALLTGAGLDIALNLALVPEWGTLGAATATSFSLMTVALMNVANARRALGVEIAIWRG